MVHFFCKVVARYSPVFGVVIHHWLLNHVQHRGAGRVLSHWLLSRFALSDLVLCNWSPSAPNKHHGTHGNQFPATLIPSTTHVILCFDFHSSAWCLLPVPNSHGQRGELLKTLPKPWWDRVCDGITTESSAEFAVLQSSIKKIQQEPVMSRCVSENGVYPPKLSFYWGEWLASGSRDTLLDQSIEAKCVELQSPAPDLCVCKKCWRIQD